MSGFEHHAEEARRIEQQIVRQGIALGIDWDDAVAVRALAREALACHIDAEHPATPANIEKLELFGLAQLMLKVMAESANEEDLHTHGGPVWKAFGRALWLESQQKG
jgi:hypothetical protein